jgi:hypothetical protein
MLVLTGLALDRQTGEQECLSRLLGKPASEKSSINTESYHFNFKPRSLLWIAPWPGQKTIAFHQQSGPPRSARACAVS